MANISEHIRVSLLDDLAESYIKSRIIDVIESCDDLKPKERIRACLLSQDLTDLFCSLISNFNDGERSTPED